MSEYDELATVSATHAGRRIRLLRIERGMSREQLSTLSGRPLPTLDAIENGRRVADRVSHLQQIAEALGVTDLTEITGGPVSFTMTGGGRAIHPAVSNLAALMRRPAFGAMYHPGMATPAEITERTDEAWRIWHTRPNFYTELAEFLPALIRDAEGCARSAGHTPGEEDHWRDAQRSLARAYHVARMWLRKVGEFALSDIAGERALHASELTDDPLLIGFSAWNLVGNHSAAGRYEAGENVAQDAIDYLESLTTAADSDELQSMIGALELYACIIDARQEDADAAWARWNRADEISRRLGPDYFHPWTCFGAANLSMYAIGIPVELGQGGDAVRAAERFDVETMPCVERRARTLIDLGQAYALRGDDTAALSVYLQAEEVSAEEVRYSSYARDVVRVLLRRSRATNRRALVDFATRMNVTV